MYSHYYSVWMVMRKNEKNGVRLHQIKASTTWSFWWFTIVHTVLKFPRKGTRKFFYLYRIKLMVRVSAWRQSKVVGVDHIILLPLPIPTTPLPSPPPLVPTGLCWSIHGSVVNEHLSRPFRLQTSAWCGFCRNSLVISPTSSAYWNSSWY